MRWQIYLLFAVLFLQIGIVSATTGFEQNSIFVDHENVTLIEKVEDNLGNPCVDCDVLLTLIYPNQSLFVVRNMNMTQLNSTGHYNSSDFLNMTTLGDYLITINATRNTASGLFNGSSDRTFVTVVDVYPPVESEWEMGLTLALLASGFLFMYIFNKSESTEVRQLFFLMALAMPMAQLGLLHNILRVDVGAGSLSSVTGTMFRIYSGVFVFVMVYYLLIIFKNLFSWYLGGFKSRKTVRG